MKAIAFSVLAVILLISMSSCEGAGERARQGNETISTDNYANRTISFYYYIPAKALKDKNTQWPVMGLFPGLSGNGESAVDQKFRDLADREGFVIIAPSFRFDEKNFATETSYQFPGAWSGNAYLAMVDRLQKQSGLKLGKSYLHGFSAGAQFALRFALWRPDACSAASGHGSGGLIVPVRFVPVKFFVSVGKDDTQRINIYEIFCGGAKKQKIDVLCRIYPGGHNLPIERTEDTVKFFSDVRRNSLNRP